jgi:glycerol-3-phosphate acyltransferase PlsX
MNGRPATSGEEELPPARSIRGRSGLPIALDAMGGDRAPGEIVAGARRAVEELGLDVLLVGPDDGRLGDIGDLPLLPASEVIAMDEEPGRAVRTKKDSSLVRAAEAVRDGRAAAMVSAGNTGAAMAAALLRMGRLAGLARPAIATPLPVPDREVPTVLLDAGANAECRPEWLLQFAQMGAAYFATRYGEERPRVALLSIGEEASKGNGLVKEAHGLLAAAPGLWFVGNVEGRDLLAGEVDVVVTDGFTGNVALKALEGALSAFLRILASALESTPQAHAASPAVWSALAPYAAHVDPEETGGAMLLGVDGVCVISHGASSARAVVNALRVAHELAAADLVGALRRALSGATP